MLELLSKPASMECKCFIPQSVYLLKCLSDVVIGTSSYLMEHSHGKDMTYITNTTIEVINYVKSHNIEIRFSSEDSFRSNLVDLLSIYSTVDKIGVNRVGIADTVGCASPRQVYDLIRTLRGVVSCDIETHFHNELRTLTVLWRLVPLTSIPQSWVLVSEMVLPHLEVLWHAWLLPTESMLWANTSSTSSRTLRILLLRRSRSTSPSTSKSTRTKNKKKKNTKKMKLHHGFLRVHTQSWYLCQSHSQQPVNLRNYQPCWFRHVEICALYLSLNWMERHQVKSCTAASRDDWWAV